MQVEGLNPQLGKIEVLRLEEPLLSLSALYCRLHIRTPTRQGEMGHYNHTMCSMHANLKSISRNTTPFTAPLDQYFLLHLNEHHSLIYCFMSF